MVVVWSWQLTQRAPDPSTRPTPALPGTVRPPRTVRSCGGGDRCAPGASVGQSGQAWDTHRVLGIYLVSGFSQFDGESTLPPTTANTHCCDWRIALAEIFTQKLELLLKLPILSQLHLLHPS